MPGPRRGMSEHGIDGGAASRLRSAFARRKGSRAEREVVAMWRANGWPRACRSPGSGALRPYGPRDASPWPGDLAHVGPWIVEVKCDERAASLGRHGIEGEAFVRFVLRRMGPRSEVVGSKRWRCLFVRSARRPWRVWVQPELLAATHAGRVPMTDGWLEVTPGDFFDLARHVEHRAAAAGLGPAEDHADRDGRVPGVLQGTSSEGAVR